MPSEVPSENGVLAARAARRKYGLEDLPGTTGFADARHRSNGRLVQVKSALFERSNGDPGVFRVWKEHLRELRQARGSVVVAVVNPSNPERKVLRVAKVSPSTLLELGEFRATAQADMRGLHEARVSWREVVDL